MSSGPSGGGKELSKKLFASTNLEEAYKARNKSTLDYPDILKAAEVNTIPHTLNQVWITTESNPASIKEAQLELIKINSEKFHKMFPDAKHIMWIFNDNAISKHDKEFLQSIKGLEIKSISEHFPNDLLYQRHIKFAIEKGLYVSASDIARVMVIKALGGLYFDNDYTIYNHQLFAKALKSFNLIAPKEGCDTNFLGNSVMAATPHHPFMEIYYNSILKDFEVTHYQIAINEAKTANKKAELRFELAKY